MIKYLYWFFFLKSGWYSCHYKCGKHCYMGAHRRALYWNGMWFEDRLGKQYKPYKVEDIYVNP